MEWIGCTVFEIFAKLSYTMTLKWGSGSLKVIESGTIRSADPENLTPEANITSIGKTVAKLWLVSRFFLKFDPTSSCTYRKGVKVTLFCCCT